MDEIPAELLKEIGEKAQNELFQICSCIYEKGIWPDDFIKSILVPLEKNKGASECSDFRTISLISHASKIVLKILAERIKGKIKECSYLEEDQFGFREGCGTREAIGVLRALGERSIEVGRDVVMCFVDYEKAFDRVNWTKMMECLDKIGVNRKDAQLIKNLYLRQTAVVRYNGEDSGEAEIGRGVRQGCSLSPLLFNIYSETLMKEVKKRVKGGIKVGGEMLKMIRYADDQVILAYNERGLQKSVNILNL